MNKEDIKKALEYCTRSEGIEGCEKCPYFFIYGCNDTLCKDALNLITEQEKEIERLKAENEKYLDSIESVQAGRCRLRCQLTEQAVKQAKIDVLNELKEKIVERMGDREYMGVKYKQGVFSESEIDEMIAEVQK